ncbi:DUF4240 domain-containing protein [Streptomyces sp. NBC_01423]|uniref:DUF4240 domain-containing protein n=1 Tax=Streptomyces sp. NBC_01423 TaxID=2903860 RepID=UPI002E2CA834|nr:DUF4240 domain-containing protein [Streptomyces sp. NBC_01423]
MTWTDFWALTATLNGKATEANCHRLAKRLSRRPLPDITAFAEHHAEALYRLDQEQFGSLPVVGMTTETGAPFPQSGDSFLYARCAVVAAGREAWESALSDPAEFAPYTSLDYDGERLLYIPDEAYELATGKEWHRTTRYCYESFSNKDGWPHLRT